MPGIFLHELWKYHQRVRSNLTSDLKKFMDFNALIILEYSSCDPPANSRLPCWIHSYISDIGRACVPAFLDLTNFHMRLTEHVEDQSTNSKCASCSGIPRNKIRALWVDMMAAVHGSIAKVRATYISAMSKGSEHLYRLSLISHSPFRERVLRLKVGPDQIVKPLLHRRSIRTCPTQMSSSSHPILSVSVLIDRCWLRRHPFLQTCSLSPNRQKT